MAGSPEYLAYSPTVIFVDDAGGSGGTPLIASNFNGLRNDLATYVQNHVNGAGNRHASNDILDYYSDAVPTTRFNLLETTPYANAAAGVSTLYTQWQRNDMYAKVFKDVYGGAASSLTQRIIDYNTLTASNGSLTTIWNLLHGGSPTFGTVTGIAPSSGVTAGLFKGTSGDPDSQSVLDVTNNAGSVHYFLVTAPSVAGSAPAVGQVRGTFVALATNNSYSALQARSTDGTAGRKVISAQTNAFVEGAYITNDGAGLFKASLEVGTAIIHSGLATGSAPAGIASKGVLYYDNTLQKWRASQNGAAPVDMIGNAAANGVAGAVQFAGAGNAFLSDATNLFWDDTNNRLGLGTNTPATALHMAGVFTMDGQASAPAVGSAGKGAIFYNSTAKVFQGSLDGTGYQSFVMSSFAGNVSIQATGGTNTLTLAAPGGILSSNSVTATGAIIASGASSGLATYDRAAGVNYSMLYRSGNVTNLFASELGSSLWSFDSTTGAPLFTANSLMTQAGTIGAGAAVTGYSQNNAYTVQASETLIGASIGGSFTAPNTATNMLFRGVTVPAWTGTVTSGASFSQWIGLYLPAQPAIANLAGTDAWGMHVTVPALATNNAAALFVGTSANPNAVGIGTLANGRPLATLNVGQAATGTIGTLLNGISGGTTDILRVDPTIGTTVNANSVVQHVDQFGHLYSTQAAVPTIAAGTGAGTGPTIAIAAGSTDQKGVITLTAGTTPAASAIVATITFRNTYPVAPTVVVVDSNVGAASLTGAAKVWVDDASTTLTTFVIRVGTTQLAAAGVYRWTYVML